MTNRGDGTRPESGAPAAGENPAAAFLPYAVPQDWAARKLSRAQSVAMPLVFLVMAAGSLLTIERTGEVGSALMGAAIFGLFALAAWGITRAGVASRQPLGLVNAVVMTKAVTPTPDSWVHFAKLRGVPWPWTISFAVLGTLSGAVALWLPFSAWDDGSAPGIGGAVIVGMTALTGVGAIFFLSAAVRSLVSQAKATGWPHRHGITLGENGIAFRLLDASIDVPWAELEAVEAVFAQGSNPNRPPLPTLRISFTDGERSFSTQMLDASPVLLFTTLRFYQDTPEARPELGTTVGQRRMDAWHRAVLAS